MPATTIGCWNARSHHGAKIWLLLLLLMNFTLSPRHLPQNSHPHLVRFSPIPKNMKEVCLHECEQVPYLLGCRQCETSKNTLIGAIRGAYVVIKTRKQWSLQIVVVIVPWIEISSNAVTDLWTRAKYSVIMWITSLVLMTQQLVERLFLFAKAVGRLWENFSCQNKCPKL